MRDADMLLQPDTTGIGLQSALYHGEQAGLASAIGTRQADLLARMDNTTDVAEQAFTVASAGDIIKTEHVDYFTPSDGLIVHPNRVLER